MSKPRLRRGMSSEAKFIRYSKRVKGKLCVVYYTAFERNYVVVLKEIVEQLPSTTIFCHDGKRQFRDYKSVVTVEGSPCSTDCGNLTLICIQQYLDETHLLASAYAST